MKLEQGHIMRYLLVYILLVTATLLHAETPAECVVEENRAKPFIKTYHEVKKVVQTLCGSANPVFSTAEIEQISKTALTMARQESSEILQAYAFYVQPWFEQVWIEAPDTKKLIFPERNYKFVGSKGLFRSGSLTVNRISEGELNKCDNEIKDCDKKFEALAYLLNAMTKPLRIQKLKVVRQHLIEVDATWDRFVTDARSQTFSDIWATTWFYEKPSSFDEKLNPPPSVQVFLFHPSIIIENVKAAIDGEQLKEGIAIEVLGFNWWDKTTSPCNIACGASFTMTYSDRPGVKDEGYGLMFHIDNKYSFGFSKHGDDTGYYVTIDLLKFLEDKKSQLTAWKI